MTRQDALPTQFEIPVDKLTKFLLNPLGRKPERAEFFLRLGFHPGRPDQIGEALRRHAEPAHHVGFAPNEYGTCVVYEGTLHTPTGPCRDIRSVWQVDGTRPVHRARFVTTYRYRRASGMSHDGEASA